MRLKKKSKRAVQFREKNVSFNLPCTHPFPHLASMIISIITIVVAVVFAVILRIQIYIYIYVCVCVVNGKTRLLV